ncbi:hypothetical protein GCM10007981_16160 [Thermocladium modestius]|uniref:DUF1641 domain-containing protein n=1 Tax=Thermocladium modestius TaxID=62609 RepID=A0A830GWY3_9CREN|nr:DUF1641 domain-containing protein [Thermocladium modestius]GGP21982.1 hypothetical protein GCM10007981_16160 [Thermocladium modestius]
MAETTQTQNMDEKLLEMITMLSENMDEVKGLLDQVIELKRSGALDSLMLIINKFEEIIQYLFQEPALFRLLALLLDGSIQTMNKLDAQDVIKLKETMQSLGGCMGKNLNMETISNAKPVNGVFGLMSALNDPDIKKGLGVAMQLLKIMGSCTSKKQ